MENESKEKTVESSAPEPKYPYYRHRMMFLPMIVMILLLIFGAIFIGNLTHRRTFIGSQAYSDRHLNRSGFPGDFRPNKMKTSFHHRGIFGAITKIDGNDITIKQNDQEVIIVVASDTSIYRNKTIAKQSDIKVGDVITVRGTPGSDGNIAVKSIIIN
jgi:CBS-domain-containing membrane protein